ncbi:MAG: arginine--tRNA ligase [Actinomycetota bacterium]|nr:arginine--tRNA ligase [Actinomycetota bacterium]
MADVRRVLEARLRTAFDVVSPGADPVLRPSDHADFQANGALPLARALGREPREVAADVVAAADLDDVCASVEISGPGFVNLTLADSYVAAELAAVARDVRLGVAPVAEPRRTVVDYSAPNVAKEMHVGHLRGTIIGDALCRVLGFLGDEVVRENHLGDWGTPFGMLIEHLVDVGESEAVEELSVGDLDGFYRDARAAFDASEDLRERSRRRVVALQSGDVETLRLWRVLVAESVRYFDDVYRKLGVLLGPDDVAGESAYNEMLPSVVSDLEAAGLLVESDGARCVFPPGFENREGDPLPLIVQKSDGGFGYAATDLASIRDRVDRVGAARLLYVVGAPQSQHLAMCFAVAHLAGWLPEGVEAVHVAFGSVLGPDHKMLRSRAGRSVKLSSLLDEAVERAEATVAASGRDPAGSRAAVARAVGIGAVKYADLSTERSRDYVFDWDRMLAFDGRTAPYLQYAHARIRSVLRRPEAVAAGAGDAPVAPSVREPAERALALELLGFEAAVRAVADELAPSVLASYLYDLATAFTAFYETCPIAKAPEQATRESRLLLARLAADVLALGLDLLGIEAPDSM